MTPTRNAPRTPPRQDNAPENFFLSRRGTAPEATAPQSPPRIPLDHPAPPRRGTAPVAPRPKRRPGSPRAPVPSSIRATLLTLLCAAALAYHARAAMVRFPGEESIEWIASDCDVIVRGLATDIRPAPGFQPPDPTFTWELITVRVAETIKGPPAPTVTFWASERRPTGEQVFCLKSTPRAARGWAPSPERDKLLAACPLIMQWTTGHQWAATGKRDYPVYDADLHPHDDPSDILAALRRAAQNPAPPDIAAVELIAPPTVPAAAVSFHDLHFILVPLDPRAEDRARRWLTSANEYDRWNAVQILGRTQTPANVAALTALLDDPFRAIPAWPPDATLGRDQRADPPRTLGQYPVRRAAYDALNNWRAAPPTAVLFLRTYPTTYLRPWALPPIAVAFVTLFAAVICRRRGAFQTAIRHHADLRRLRFFHFIKQSLTRASLVLLLLTAALFVRSQWRLDALTWRTRAGVHYELTSAGGILRAAQMHHHYAPDPAPAAFTTTPLTPAAQADWAPPAYPYSPSFRHAESLRFSLETLGERHEIVAAATPLAAPCALFALLPAASALAARRRRRRRTANQCPACGYDCRATPHRCPECGADRLRIPKEAAA